MALAMLFEDDSVVIFDAVTRYNKSLSSSISTHPIDKSASISDHIFKENPVFTFSAVVSSADFHSESVRSPDLLSEYTVSSYYNNPVNPTTISDSGSFLSDLIPSSVAQIFNTPEASIDMDPFRGYSHVIARDRFNQAWENSEIVTLLDYDYDFSTGRSVEIKQIENCLIKNFEDVEDSDTGDSLKVNFTLQKVRFAFIQETEIVEQPDDDIEDDASSEEDAGDQTGNGQLEVEGQAPFYEGSPIEDVLGNVSNILPFGGGE